MLVRKTATNFWSLCSSYRLSLRSTMVISMPSLNSHIYVSPLEASLRLQLGRMYHVDHWVKPAFRNMMARPLSSISRTEAQRMGLDYYHILSHTKAVVEENYCAIAYTKPSLMQPDGCTTLSQCTTVWKDIRKNATVPFSRWWNGVVRQLLHPEAPCRGDELLELLDKTDIPGLCNLCKHAMLRRMKDLTELVIKLSTCMIK
ncbi:hypothetical protein OG21DRAFT_1544324 [Imleria badia]|nr:hypothetical protein OG21DRAFT_1544324 [Imleria badia]